ncbi:SRPBCC family protein [Aquibium sp. LZ166]|uniref:SRPBCC family protein n=1 Tax=Aquibium pacificus TaxID=3153579 RepID=A0ABV3SSM8_9HYPH
MTKPEIVNPAVAHTAMFIRRPVSEVFEALIDPAITSHFWLSKGSDRLVVGKTVKWEWEMHNMSNEVTALKIEPNKLIVMELPGYSGPTTVTWTFKEVEGGTFVEVEETGWTGTRDELVSYVCDATGGFTWVLAGMKAWLEHGLELNLIADRFPKELVGH